MLCEFPGVLGARGFTGWREPAGSRFRMLLGMRVPSFTAKAVAAFVPHYATALQKEAVCKLKRGKLFR